MTAIIGISEPTETEPRYRAASFADALHSEWTKARTVPSTRWTLIVAAVLGIGLGALVSALSARHYAQETPGSRALWDPTSISGAGLELAQLAIGVLGIMIITSEYSTGAIRTSLTAVPRRGRFLAAKALVIAGLTFAVSEITAFAAFFIGQALISGHAPTASLAQPDVLRALVGCGLYGALIGLLGLGLGALLRHASAAIAVLVALVFILPAIAAALPASIEHNVEKFWPTQAGQQVTLVVRGADSLSPWAGIGYLCLFAAVVMAASALLLNRHDA
jgi:ABC-type transport system involved in multi-copper enzyme maturation permease subunit